MPGPRSKLCNPGVASRACIRSGRASVWASHSGKRVADTFACPSITSSSRIHTSMCSRGADTVWVSKPTQEKVKESMPCGHDTRNAPAASVDTARPHGQAITIAPGNLDEEDGSRTWPSTVVGAATCPTLGLLHVAHKSTAHSGVKKDFHGREWRGIGQAERQFVH